MTLLPLKSVSVSVLCLAAGCSAAPAQGDGTGMGDGGSAGSGAGGSMGTGSTPGTGSVPGSGGGGFDPPPMGSGGGGNPDECERVTQMAEAQTGGRADIIVIVDNSGSMGDENLAVQTNLNRFSTQITGAGIDAHVVLISGAPGEGSSGWGPIMFGGAFGICLDPPLGAGGCPTADDTNLAAGYMHWHAEVGSNDGLNVIRDTFSGWGGHLRADAAKTFVMITDDESDMPAAEFTTWVNSQAVFQSALWKYSGIWCVTDGANCANLGGVHSQLATQTNGVVGDLATFAAGQVDAQFQVVFDTLGDAVIADARPVECEWDIPEVPDGEVFDRTKVNVEYTNGQMTTQVIYKVANEAACTENVGGWFYDDDTNPTRVRVCQSSCNVIQSDLQARIDVVFGCASEEPPIQ